MSVENILNNSHWGAFRMTVRDGRLESIRPFELDPAPNSWIQSWQEMATSPLRVATPSIRQGYLDGDGGKGRGRDHFVSVEWDHALDLAADEVARVRDRYGNSAIFGGSYGWASAGRIHHARSLLHRFLASAGGFVSQIGNYSYGAAIALLPFVVGASEGMRAHVTSLDAVAENADLMLAFGGIPAKNWEVQSGGLSRHSYAAEMVKLAKGGVEIITISPFRGDHPQIEGLAGSWQPIRPSSDTALLLALIRELCVLGKVNQAFLDRYTSGWEELERYLSGARDGIEKNADWAAPLCAINADDIRAIARKIATRRTMLTATWSLQRAENGEQVYWALIALACALGQIGLPGRGYAFGYGSIHRIGDRGYFTPVGGVPVPDNPVNISIPCARVTDMLLHPGKEIPYATGKITYPDIRLIYWAGGNPFHHHQNLKSLADGFRRVDTVIVNEMFWTATARHADIVFPATIPLERDDISGSSRDSTITAMHRGPEPFGQARDDYAIFTGLAERLGCADQFTEGRTPQQWIVKAWDQIRDKLAKRKITAPDFETFWQGGFYQMPEPENAYTQFSAFRADPVANPLQTPSGRIELFSPRIAASGLAGILGHPQWIEPTEWLGRAHPNQLHLLSPQPAGKLHSQLEFGAASRALKINDREQLTMNPQDARERGIGNGRPVRVSSSLGSCLAVARLDAGLQAGVVLLPTGATYDPDAAGNDSNSNPNVLIQDIGTSELAQGCAAQSCLVTVERWEGSLPALTVTTPPLQFTAVTRMTNQLDR